MRLFIAGALFLFVSANSSYAQDLTQQQVEAVQTAIKAAGCTVEDTAITARDYGYKADGAVCGDRTYIVKLDKEFKVTQKKQKPAE
jgi:hypothetical protein